MKKFNLYLDPRIQQLVDDQTKDCRGLEKAKRIIDEMTTLSIMKTLYNCPNDLKNIPIFFRDHRYLLLDRMAKATRMRASISIVSSSEIRLSFALIEKGEKDYFYYISFLIGSNGELIKIEIEDLKLNSVK